MITAAELADLQALWESALDTTATVYHRTETSDGQGGTTITETTYGPYAARLQPAGGGTLALWGGLPVEPDAWRVMLPHDATIAVNDRLVSGGESFEVRAVDTGRSNRFGLQALCTRSGA